MLGLQRSWPLLLRRCRNCDAHPGGLGRCLATRLRRGAGNVCVRAETTTPLTANTSVVGSSIALTKGIAVLPTASARMPAARQSAAVNSVTVVLPFVPVMASSGRLSHQRARSNSLRIGVPSCSAAPITSWESPSPGLGRRTDAASSAALKSTSERGSIVRPNASARALAPG